MSKSISLALEYEVIPPAVGTMFMVRGFDLPRFTSPLHIQLTLILEAIAREAAMSPEAFCRLFRKTTGRRFSERKGCTPRDFRLLSIIFMYIAGIFLMANNLIMKRTRHHD